MLNPTLQSQKPYLDYQIRLVGLGLNKRQRDFLYPQIVKKQGGEYCKGCGKSIDKIQENLLMIDHIDNNNSNNILDNLQLLCRACNIIKNH